jgi:transcriptional regulator with XRE-family HTH domain
MPDRRRRTGATRLRARDRARYLLERIGRAVREARMVSGRTQAEIAAVAGVSQPFLSRLERGQASNVTVETVAACAEAVGLRLAAFVETAPGAAQPRDLEHLRRQQLVIDVARAGGWRAATERAIDPDAIRSRAIDVYLERPPRREIAVVEIEDLLADVGDAMRRLGDKVAAVRRSTATDDPAWKVSGLLVLRATRRNRRIVHAFAGVFDARLGGSSSGWLSALTRADRPMPDADGLAWSSVRGERMFAARQRERAA